MRSVYAFICLNLLSLFQLCFILKKNFLINLFLAVPGLCCFAWVFLSCGKPWLLFFVVHRLLPLVLVLWSTGCRFQGFTGCGSQAAECWLSGWDPGAQLLCSMWTLPRPEMGSMSPELSGKFLSFAPPGNSRFMLNRYNNKRLDLIDRVPEELWMDVCNVVKCESVKEYSRQWSKSSPEKEMPKGQIVAWGGLTNRWEKKRSKRQRRKGKIYPSERRVPKHSKERLKKFFS